MTCGSTNGAWSDPSNGAVYTFTVGDFAGSLYLGPVFAGTSNEGIALIVIGNMQWLGKWTSDFGDGFFFADGTTNGEVFNSASMVMSPSNASCDGSGNVTSVTDVDVTVPWASAAISVTLTRAI